MACVPSVSELVVSVIVPLTNVSAVPICVPLS
jgi:hypothetical protein